MTDADPVLTDAVALLQKLLEHTRQCLWIHAQVELLYTLPDATLGTHLAHIARRHRHTDIRLLVDDDLALRERMPELVASIQRLPSVVSVRRLDAAEDHPLRVTVLADHHGWMQLTRSGNHHILRGDPDDRRNTRRAAQDFESHWSLSDEAIELRRVLV